MLQCSNKKRVNPRNIVSAWPIRHCGRMSRGGAATFERPIDCM